MRVAELDDAVGGAAVDQETGGVTARGGGAVRLTVTERDAV